MTEAETAELSAVAGRFGKGQLLAHCRLLEEALFAMQKANAVKRVVAELTLLRLCDPTLDDSDEGLLARIEKLEDAVAAGSIAAPAAPAPAPEKAAAKPAAPRAEKPTVPAKKPEQGAEKPASAPAPAGGRVLHRLRGFINCVERIQREKPMLGAWLGEAACFVSDDGGVTVRLPNLFARMMVEQNEGRDVLRRALSAELRREVPDRALVLEVPDEVDPRDTVLDDLIDAAGDSGKTM